MPKTQDLPSVNSGDVVLVLGTGKGLFLLHSSAKRQNWSLAGPFAAGRSIYAATLDLRNGRRRLLAASDAAHWGTSLTRSDDFGRTWHTPDKTAVRYPDGSGDALKQIWEIVPGHASEPDVLRLGTNPAALFESRDAGESWNLCEGLYNHPHRKQWFPGAGGLCLHTILQDSADPRTMRVAISTGGVYRTTDGGRSWIHRNKGISCVFMPGPPPEFGQCVHRIVSHPSNPGRIFLQNHWGLFRSDDGADTWIDIGAGFAWTFGFAMAMHPHQPDTVYILPLESDEFRCTPEGRLRVFRTRNGGQSWEALTNGLPQENALETVLRHGMQTDPLNPAGLYFGTKSGKVFASFDDGDSWRMLAEGLPPVQVVNPAVIP